MSAHGTPKVLVCIEDYPAGEPHGRVQRGYLHQWLAEYAEQCGIVALLGRHAGHGRHRR